MIKEINPQDKVRADLEFLVSNIKDPQARVYLKVPVSESLQRIGHDPYDVKNTVDAYFNISLN